MLVTVVANSIAKDTETGIAFCAGAEAGPAERRLCSMASELTPSQAVEKLCQRGEQEWTVMVRPSAYPRRTTMIKWANDGQ